MIIRHTCARLARSRRSQQLPVDRLFPFARARRCQGLNPIGRCYATENTTQYAPEDTSFPSFDPPIPVTLQRALAETRDDPKVSHEVETYLNRNRIRHTTGTYGSDVSPHYQPNDLLDNPPTPSDVSIELLLASQTHLGHSTSLWNPANSRYIHGIREGVHIISLDTTAAHLRRAAKIVSGVAERGGTILFAGTRRGHERIVVRAAELAGACHLFERWTPGSITNGQQILGRCEAKVVDEHDREIAGFESQLDELPVLKPELIVCLNPLENYVMLHECGLTAIPTIGIIDTDANPTWVTYPIPANDDSLRSVAVIAGVLGRAGQEGLALRRAAAKQGQVTYPPPVGLQPLHEGRKKKKDRKGNEIDDEGGPPAGMERMGRGTNYIESGDERELGIDPGKPIKREMERIREDDSDYEIREEADADMEAKSLGDDRGDADFTRELSGFDEEDEEEDLYDTPMSQDVESSQRYAEKEADDLERGPSGVR